MQPHTHSSPTTVSLSSPPLPFTIKFDLFRARIDLQSLFYHCLFLDLSGLLNFFSKMHRVIVTKVLVKASGDAEPPHLC